MKIKNDIKKAILNSKSTAIVCHQNPDGDTLGSGFALCGAIKKMGKNPDLFCADPLPLKYSFLGDVKLLNKIDNDKYDLVIFVDCGDRKLTGHLLDDFDYTDVLTINIDHHPTNSMHSDINHVLSTYSSTAEVILELIQHIGVDIDKKMAESLYVGILTDTGQFAYSYTSQRTHEHAAFLHSRGIDFSKINTIIFGTMPIEKLLLMKRMLHNLEMKQENQIAISLLTTVDFNESGASEQDTGAFVNMLLSVDTVKIAVLLRQIDDNNFKASFRSIDGLDISKAAQLLNGGGHKQASGAKIECKIDNAIDTIINAINEAKVL